MGLRRLGPGVAVLAVAATETDRQVFSFSSRICALPETLRRPVEHAHRNASDWEPSGIPAPAATAVRYSVSEAIAAISAGPS